MSSVLDGQANEIMEMKLHRTCDTVTWPCVYGISCLLVGILHMQEMPS